MTVLSDAMYSDSDHVLDGLADLIEATLCIPKPADITRGRMNQVQFILAVDEASFQANFSAEHLSTIESKEMSVIISDISSAVGLQRFRFSDRQSSGKCSRHCLKG